MTRTLMKSKIHRATITEANIHYEGSMTIDQDLMEAADIVPFEQIQVYNIANGERFSTYALEGPRGSGVICLNGAAARKGVVGDLVIIATYAAIEEKEIQNFKPKIVQVDIHNHLRLRAA
ncbi:MAG: aspartate 1-decarboxylase [Desulfobacca sp.]|nr:aspartate 1-decarboxylase [Desulfobacca sp.]